MGAWYHKQRAACDIAGNPNRQCRRLDDLLMPRDGPIRHVLADRPGACATAFRRANWPRKSLAGRAIEHGRFVVLRQLDRSERVAQGGCPASPRPRHVHCRHPDARRAGRGLRPQRHGACERPPRDPAAGHRRPRLHPGRHRPAQHPRSRPRARRPSPQPLPGAGRRTGALCRPADRRLHAADPRPGRGPRRSCRARARPASRRGRCGRGDAAGQPARVRQLAGQRLHRQRRERRRSHHARRRADPACAASSA